MRAYDLTPFYRSTVGFDRLFENLDAATRSDYPPYDIERTGTDEYRITMAVAGFSQSEIDLNQHGTSLTVTGSKAQDAQERQFLHRGIADRNFRQAFNLADHVKVTGASLESGLLSIDLMREVPEQLKSRRIEIGSANVAQAQVQDNVSAEVQKAA